MEDEFESIDDNYGMAKPLPNATAVLVLGILSIVTCFAWGIIGAILGIIALALHKKDKEVYMTNKSAYAASFKNSNGGKICAIIGLCLSALFLIYIIIMLVFAASYGSGMNYYYR